MSNFKTQADQHEVEAFLADRLHVTHVELETISAGEGSQAFFFEGPDGPEVLRVNNQSKEGFLKDKFAQEHYGSDELPIPKVLDIGEMSNGQFYAISERAAGLPLDHLTDSVMDKITPTVIEKLEVIHATKPAGEGYGWWDIDGVGKSATWREAVEEMRGDSNSDQDIKTPYFDGELSNSVRDDITKLIQFCPEERKLVHADYGFDNVIADESGVNGVIDWHPSMYGDPLYDVAWLAFWDYKQDQVAVFKEYYESHGGLPENFMERVTCYALIIGVKSLRFFAKSEQEDKHKFAVERVALVRGWLEPGNGDI